MIDLGASLSILSNESIWVFVLKGIGFTILISIISVIFGLVFGSVLAMVRNYCDKGLFRILRWLATVYIEIFRNTPLLLWIFICLVFCPVPAIFSKAMLGLTSVETKVMFRCCVALVLFTSSVIAEIVRGGLNSVHAGQFEAGHSQGFNTPQIMLYIVLPQAFRAIIPTLLSQVITTVKDSSYMANVAVIELMSRVRKILSTSNMYNGVGVQLVSDVFVLFGLAFLIYFVINFTISCLVRYMQTRRKRLTPATRVN